MIVKMADRKYYECFIYALLKIKMSLYQGKSCKIDVHRCARYLKFYSLHAFRKKARYVQAYVIFQSHSQQPSFIMQDPSFGDDTLVGFALLLVTQMLCSA